ncbi:FMN-dependent NADH-azoreductase [Aureibacillus halotolerans]|uniref:FMN dependent NADH:quinone oxidoreductase n=1 Tax=Aureibacillus halotolerans TaxID=1508390 RepID=A0A4R6UD93_9BACI|nr:FMN-dependent NADH-azoreductase [Aureibacillus halotolerans]TDQ41074.1 FMN-dependent NADH-azoreductase [Aureibacillus halotolerans]
MSKVLFIKANDRPAEQSVSVKLYDTFLESYRANHPEDDITELNLFDLNLPYYGNKAITSMYKRANELEMTTEEADLSQTIVQYLDQFLAAEKIVIAFPLWNFTVPAPLVTYLSYIMQAGKTFRYTANGPEGLASDKTVALLTARGGNYSGDLANAEMALRLVSQTLGLAGITTPELVIVEGHNAAPEQAENIIATGVDQAKTLAATF